MSKYEVYRLSEPSRKVAIELVGLDELPEVIPVSVAELDAMGITNDVEREHLHSSSQFMVDAHIAHAMHFTVRAPYVGTDKPVGIVSLGLKPLVSGYTWAFSSIYLTDERARGRGVGTLAMAALAHTAFSGFELSAVPDRLIAPIRSGNAASIAMHTRLGYVPMPQVTTDTDAQPASSARIRNYALLHPELDVSESVGDMQPLYENGKRKYTSVLAGMSIQAN